MLIAGLFFTSVVVSDETLAELPDITGGYLCSGRCGPGNACATIDQDGVELTLVNPQGQQSRGRFLSNSEIEFVDLVGFIDDKSARIVWDNNTIWIRTTLCPGP